VAYSDYEIGRVIQAVEDMGKLDTDFSDLSVRLVFMRLSRLPTMKVL
jgi:hypothetical protein